MKRYLILYSSILLSLLAYSDDPDLPPPSGDADSLSFDLTQPKDYISDFPNEFISVQKLDLKLKYNDVLIKGNNGMDIKVIRHYGSGRGGRPGLVRGWKHTIPAITLSRGENPSQGTETFGCIGAATDISFNLGEQNLRPVGYSRADKVPSNTIAAFDNNSIFRCEDSVPVIITSDGKKYFFGEFYDHSSPPFYKFTHFLSKIEDIHGNTIDYHWVTENTSAKRRKLDKITRNDGAVVQFNYRTSGNSEILESIDYAGKRISYTFDNEFRLVGFHDEENRLTKYTYTPYFDNLESIETPDGLKVVYDYYPVNDSTFNSGNLRTRTISGNGLETRIFHHEFILHDGNRTKVIEFNVDGGLDLTTEYIIDKTHPSGGNFESGKVSLAGQILSKAVYIGETKNKTNTAYIYRDRKLYFEERSFSYSNAGTHYCKKAIVTYARIKRTCARSYMTKNTIHIESEIGSYNTYTTEYSQHNEYGEARYTKEYSNGSHLQKHAKVDFAHDMNKFVLNTPKKLQMSINGANWKTVKEVEYYASTKGNGYSLQPKHKKSHGEVIETFTHYHPNGELKTVKDSNGKTYDYSNYSFGLAKEKKLPAISVAEKLEINTNGTIKSVTDFKGNKTQYKYDNLKRLTQVSYPIENNKAFWNQKNIQYGKVNNQDIAISGSGLSLGMNKRVETQASYKRTTYLDSRMQPVLSVVQDSTKSNSKIYKRFKYDRFGKTIFESYPSTNASATKGVHYGYDYLGRKITTSHAQGTISNTYMSGNRVKIEDARGNRTTYGYQAYGKPNQREVVSIESPEGIKTLMLRDELGKIKIIQQSGSYGNQSLVLTRSNIYDNRQKLCKVSDPEIGDTYYRYDNAGLLKWEIKSTINYCSRTTAPTGATKYHYNARGGLDYIDYPAGTTDFDFDFDVNGNMTLANHGDISRTYTYDSLNNIKTESLVVEGRTFKVSYDYDKNGFLEAITYPSGRRVPYTPNAMGQPTKVSTFANNILYHTDGSIKQFAYGGSNKLYKRNLNAEQLPESIKVSGLVSLEYDYDANANVTEIKDNLFANETRTLGYDDMDRLTNANGSWGISSFNYDPFGNLMTKRLGNKFYFYQYNRATNLLTGVSGSKNYGFAYDANGNIENNGHDRFTHDKANLLTKVNNGAKASYLYDAHKRRVAVKQDGTTIYHFYSKDGKLLYKYDSNDRKSSDYIYLKSLKIAKVDHKEPTPIPETPLNLSSPANISSPSIVVDWLASEYATSYQLYESFNNGNWNSVYDGNKLQTTLTNRGTGTWRYKIKACNETGCSGFSSHIQVYVSVPTPAKPTSISAPASTTTNYYKVSWNASSHATQYILEEKKNFNGSWSVIHNGTTLFSLRGNQSYATYYYRLKACSVSGCSPYSETISVIVKRPAPCNPVCTIDDI